MVVVESYAGSERIEKKLIFDFDFFWQNILLKHYNFLYIIRHELRTNTKSIEILKIFH